MPKTISIIIPCYNEAQHIDTIIKAVYHSPIPDKKEIIVIDDASTDNSSKQLQNNPYIHTLIKLKKNRGKGHAIKTGLKAANGDIAIIQDADLEYCPSDYPALIQPIKNGSSQVVYGSRFLKKDAIKTAYLSHIWANQFLTKLSNLFTGFKLSDMETGYKVFTKKVYKELLLKESRFGVEPEITAKLSRLNINITEVPISYSPRKYKDGKKIGLKDGLRAIYCIIKYAIKT